MWLFEVGFMHRFVVPNIGDLSLGSPICPDLTKFSINT